MLLTGPGLYGACPGCGEEAQKTKRTHHVQSKKKKKAPDYFAWQLRHGFQRANKNLFDAQFILKMGEQIKLSTKQAEKIESIMFAYQEFSIRISAEVKIRELRFTSYLGKDKPDKKQMAGHIREIGKQKTDWVVAYINYLLDLRGVLTGEQLNVLSELAKKQKKDRRQRSRPNPYKDRQPPKNSEE
jgi:Spy/CpxP family protein refolding chaperone